MRIVALVLALLLITPAAHAGGWAVTYLDRLPSSMEPGRTYTVGYWVLQHGTHPYSGDLGPTALRFVRDGRSVAFSGVALLETSHYAAAVSLPAGTWQVFGVQGLFAEHEIGTLFLPGPLQVKPVEKLQPWPDAAKPWNDIKPPTMPVVSPAAVTSDAPPPATELPIWIVVVVLLGAGGLWFLVRRRAVK